jgi:hypothetical protein
MIILLQKDDEFYKDIKHLSGILSKKVQKSHDEKYIDNIPLKAYFYEVNKVFKEKSSRSKLVEYFTLLLNVANFYLKPINLTELQEVNNHLITIMRENFADTFSVLYYLDIINYVIQFIEEKEIFCRKEVDTIIKFFDMNDENEIESLKKLWLVGIYCTSLFNETISQFDEKLLVRKRNYETNLIDISSFFEQNVPNGSNLILGDIGLTFGINPMSIIDTSERLTGIFILTDQGKWVSPEIITHIFSDRYNCIQYCEIDNDEANEVDPIS